jgi:hypothetical protein
MLARTLIQRWLSTRSPCSSATNVSRDLGAGPSTVDLGIDGEWWTEQTDRLIDQMAPEVEQEAAGFLGVSPFTPRPVAAGRPPPFEPRLEPEDRPEHLVGDEPAHREQIPVPSAVLEDGEEQIPFGSGDLQAAALLGGRCHGLVDHDREPRPERGQSERHVGPVRRCHDDQVVLREFSGAMETTVAPR